MPFRFRKSWKIAPGMRLNLGKRGFSGSIGAGGLRYSTAKQGGSKKKAATNDACLYYLLIWPFIMLWKLIILPFKIAWWLIVAVVGLFRHKPAA